MSSYVFINKFGVTLLRSIKDMILSFFYDAEATICVKETTHYTQ